MTVPAASPFVFNGHHGGGGPCNGEPDVTPGADLNNNGCYYGGGVNSATQWSEAAQSQVPVPARWGEIETNWNQKVVRITTVADGGGLSPGPQTTSEDVIDAVNEMLAQSGLIALIETHDLTGGNVAPVGVFNQPTPAPGVPNSWENQIIFWDAVVTAFSGNDRVWFNFSNEPATEINAPAAWQAQATFWVRRTREHLNAPNIIVLDLASWGQDLKGLADGAYDIWFNALPDNSNVGFGWHAYGSRQGTAYTYATMEADIIATLQRGYAVIIAEYGQSAAIGSGNAGPDQWNRNAVSWLTTTAAGPPLAELYKLMPVVWHATGDATFWHSYKLTQGDDPNNPNGSLSPGVNGWSIPFWDITAATANASYLEELGIRHWDFSH